MFDKPARVRLLAALTLLISAAGVGAAAPEPADNPRLVTRFDFEERDEGNFEQLPRHWLNIVDTGFPRHTADRTGFDTTHAASGEHSLKLHSDGGSAALTLRRGVIAAIPGAAYELRAKVRTAAMNRARARLSAFLIDDHGDRIDGSDAASDLVVSNGAWRELSLRLGERDPDAAWIILRLELLQPSQFQASRLGDHAIRRQDIGATAWFDDVTLIQVPRLELATDGATNLIRAPQRPTIRAVVEDFAADDLTASLIIRDHNRQIVARQQRSLTGRQPPRWQWTPDLPQFGWYELTMDVRNAAGRVGIRQLGFCWLPEKATPAASIRLGVNADRLPASLRPILPEALSEIGAGSAIVPLWQADDDQLAVDRVLSGKDPLLDRLAERAVEVTAAFAGVPERLADKANVDVDRPLTLFAGDPDFWKQPLERYAAELAHVVDRWQIGPSDGLAVARRAEAIEGYRAARTVLGRLTAGRATVLPWPAELSVDAAPESSGMLMVRVPTQVRPDHVSDYAQQWAALGDRVSVSLESLSARRYDGDARATDLTQRLLEAWATDAKRVYVDLPWHTGEAEGDAPSPDALAAVLANLHDRLADRQVVGQFELAPDVPARVLDGPRGGAIVAWSQSPNQPRTELTLDLGRTPRAFDVWGNPVAMDAVDERHRFTVGRRPIFLESIDPTLARFRAGLTLKPRLVESANREHKLTLSITNPWPHALAGTLRFDPPERWSIRPALLNLSIAPGQTSRHELTLHFPLSETAGRKLITAHADVQTNRRHDIALKLPLEIGLEDIQFEAHLNIHHAGQRRDARITLIVTNHGSTPRSFYAFALAPEQPARQRIISRLSPGQTIIKRLTMPDAGRELAGQHIRVGLRELDGPAMLSELLKVP